MVAFPITLFICTSAYINELVSKYMYIKFGVDYTTDKSSILRQTVRILFTNPN